jgi:hypothetical protein
MQRNEKSIAISPMTDPIVYAPKRFEGGRMLASFLAGFESVSVSDMNIIQKPSIRTLKVKLEK